MERAAYSSIRPGVYATFPLKMNGRLIAISVFRGIKKSSVEWAPGTLDGVMNKVAFGIVLLAVALTATTNWPGRRSAELTQLKSSFRRPTTLPFPETNPFSRAKYELGKKLFFDRALSRDHTLSCATCHDPAQNFADGRPKGMGIGQRPLTRRVPELWNVAWGKPFFWDGRATTLEEQALGPIQNPNEMALPLAELERRLNASPAYRDLFRNAFGNEVIRAPRVAQALATFERTLVSPKTAFDRWVEGDDGALTRSQVDGLLVFVGKANCVQCHTGWNFTNQSFADIGLTEGDRGRGTVLNDGDADFAFKTPSLRQVTAKPFLLHDGSATSVEALIENYDQGGQIKRRTAQLWLRPLNLTRKEKRDLAEFLNSLSTETRGNLWSTNSHSR